MSDYYSEYKMITNVTINSEERFSELKSVLLPGEPFVFSGVGGILEAFMLMESKAIVHLVGGHEVHFNKSWK